MTRARSPFIPKTTNIMFKLPIHLLALLGVA
jgi:hypothetical protein